MATGSEGFTTTTDIDPIQELLTRGVDSVYPSADALAAELQTGRQLTAYMGIDPTAPDMHVGHESQLLKLRRLQDMGHNVILLIGDFTATIGDPTDKSASRVKLTREEVMENAHGYQTQASKILDFGGGPNPAQLRYNSDWLGKMSFADVLELAGEVTVQQMLERDMFRRRIREGKPVGLHEFMYPIMQGWDSVAMGVDIEVGGSDQIFNMLVGSTFVKRHCEGKQKYVIAGDILADPSGKKIGKTEGNMITLNDDPASMYHKIMLWGDGIAPHALELCSRLPMDEIQRIRAGLEDGSIAGLDAKRFLARTIVTELHGNDAAVQAEESYAAITSRNGAIDIAALAPATVSPGQGIIDVLCASGLASSKSAARRLLDAGAIRLNGVTVSDAEWRVPESADELILRAGKPRVQNHRRLVIGSEDQQGE